MDIFGSTHKGLVRSVNQDYFEFHHLSPNAAFAIVCDGMGGANAGNVASKIAVETISKYIKSSYGEKLSSVGLENLLRSALVSANISIYETASKDAELKGMGTTVVLVFVLNNIAYILHVGDSRVYYFNNGKLNQVTVDHSMVQSLVDSGEITADEAKSHPKKNIITRALGVNYDVSVDLQTIDFDDNCVLLLCSDGLSNYVSKEGIIKQLSLIDDTVTTRLIAEANYNGGGDNITAVVVAK